MNAPVSIDVIRANYARIRRRIYGLDDPSQPTIALLSGKAVSTVAQQNEHIYAWLNHKASRALARKTPHPNAIKGEIARRHGLSVEDVVGPVRSERLIIARFELAYRLRTECGMSLSQVGRHIGNRDHTTVLHAIRKHAERLAQEAAA